MMLEKAMTMAAAPIKSPVKRQPAGDHSSSGSSSSPAGSCSDAQTWVQDSAHGAVTDAPPCCPGSPEEIMSVDEERMLRGAFIIHAELPAPLTRSQVMEPMLPSDPAACLRKFRAILLAVGLKCDDVQFQRDFDQARGYYISEGEAAVVRAWHDLHAGTGRRARDGRDFIAAADLRRVLTHECERLTDEEAAELLQECRPDADGRVYFEERGARPVATRRRRAHGPAAAAALRSSSAAEGPRGERIRSAGLGAPPQQRCAR
ncbi:hypothetical protein JKP88DRAFT_350749 [Tribonema minus]|uniref:Uncharacterized protein n=1 Tax=Tribonema minus TaxID=303371 RepID=A0A835YNZ8_9STRA|nr:hypothetical protein JKP88DRAFT_350749 [Tribonema minus]